MVIGNNCYYYYYLTFSFSTSVFKKNQSLQLIFFIINIFVLT